MKTSKLVCILGLALVAGLSLVRVHGKRQYPSHNEIERVINDTHSIIWKCLNTECHPGSGLNVQCGTSISINIPILCVPCVKGVNYSSTQDYSTCKSCRNCAKHENKRGECTPEEDTTECLGTCYKGFYMNKITEDCHQCSDCCNNVTAKTQHEIQCEDSGRPPNQQCRQSNIKCPHPSKPMASPLGNNLDNEQGSKWTLTIALVIPGVFFIFLLIVFLVLLKCYGWKKMKSSLIKWCLTERNSVDDYAIDLRVEGVSEATHRNVGGNNITEGGDVLTNLSSLPGAKTMKRPMFQRLQSVPVETQSKSKIPRSFSHPGALKDLTRLDKLKQTLNFRSGFTPQDKKQTKKGYTLVETEPPMIDNLPNSDHERVDRAPPIVRLSVGADEPDNKSPAPTKLLEFDDLPVENHGNDCSTKPASSGAVPGYSIQSAGSVGKDPGKERLQKPSVTDQSTSTTELHLSSAKKVSHIPQVFLDCCLNERMLAIPIEFLRRICVMLDIPRELYWDDYRLLAEKVGLNTDFTDISWLGKQNNKTELILQQFNSQKDPSIRRFKAILDEMKRNDVVTVIEGWIQYEWAKQNNNSSLDNFF